MRRLQSSLVDVTNALEELNEQGQDKSGKLQLADDQLQEYHRMEALEDEIAKLRDKLSYMEKSYLIKCEEAASAIESKEKQITSLVNEISVLRTDVSQRLPQVEKLEMELASSKSALDEQYKRWRSAQENYERQRDWAELKELQEQGDLVTLQYLQEVETSRTEEDNRNEEVECFKQKLLEAEKKIQFFEQKLEEADRTCLEQKLEESEKACLELRRRVTYIEDEKKSLKQNVIEMEKLLLEYEDLRKDLHNQMMALKGNMRVFCRVRPLAAKDNPNDQKLIIFPESLEYSGRGLQVVHNVSIPCFARC
ncbi:kinesin-like protein KIN-14M [Setaria italica]|uniref:kinesin-like protein KIN-14M n=1 Tax=Setaria italica TaxID=4555 RepID=UPI000648F999|nr:kinesin-like protein KIN-14M [Setaria italica]